MAAPRPTSRWCKPSRDEGAWAAGDLLSLHPDGRGRPATRCRTPIPTTPAASGQPHSPWRGRITCSPAAGFAGTVDKTATAAAQVAALWVGRGGGPPPGPASFGVSGSVGVVDPGPPVAGGLRRMVLHYAHLCAAAGGVDAFPDRHRDAGADDDPLRARPLIRPCRRIGTCSADVRSILGRRHQDRIRGGLVGVFRAPAGSTAAVTCSFTSTRSGRSGDRPHWHRQLHAAVGLARRLRARGRGRGLARDP